MSGGVVCLLRPCANAVVRSERPSTRLETRLTNDTLERLIGLRLVITTPLEQSAHRSSFPQ